MTTAAAISPKPYPQTATAAAADAVTLSETNHSRLQTFVHAGHASARVRTSAQVLLKRGEGGA